MLIDVDKMTKAMLKNEISASCKQVINICGKVFCKCSNKYLDKVYNIC